MQKGRRILGSYGVRCCATTSRLLLALLVLITLSGCRAVEEFQDRIGELHARGDYAAAKQVLFSKEAIDAYGDKNTLLLQLERGAASLAAGDGELAITSLDKADQLSSFLYEMDTGSAVSQWVFNDSASAYYARPYEDIYVNVLKQVAFLEQGRIDNAATVESERQLNKSQFLRAKYDQFLQRAEADAEQRGLARSRANSDLKFASGGGGEFVNSTLGCYLSAVIYMLAGNTGQQEFATASLQDTIARHPTLFARVDPAKIAALKTLTEADANVLVISFVGRSPRVREREIMLPITGQFHRIPFPEMIMTPSQISGVGVEVDGISAAEQMDLIEDMALVMRENFERNLPSVYTRTMIRLAVKLGIVAGASYGVHAGTNDGALTAITAIGATWLMMQSEQADVRSWTMLPGRAYVKLMKLPPGEHRVGVAYNGPGAGGTAWHTVTVPPPGVLDHCGLQPQMTRDIPRNRSLRQHELEAEVRRDNSRSCGVHPAHDRLRKFSGVGASAGLHRFRRL